MEPSQDEALSGRWLKRRRRALGLTQEELARRAGCSTATVRKFESEERRPSPQVGMALAEVLGLPSGESRARERPDGPPNGTPGRHGAWRLHLLGEAAELTGPSTRWRPPRTASLILAFLALEGATPRERLAGLLWPERPEPRARANLRQALLRLRQRAPVVDATVVTLSDALWVDARDLPDERLSELAPSPLLRTLDASERPEFAAWLEAARERVAVRQETALIMQIERARDRGDPEGGVAAAVRWTRLRPWSEQACRTVMEYELERGEPAAALRAFGRLRAALETEFRTSAAAPTLALARRAASTAAGDLQSAPPSLTEAGRPLARSAEAGGWMEEGAALLRSGAQTLTDPTELGNVLVELAWLEHRLGRNTEAEACAGRALRLLDDGRDGNAAGVTEAHFALGSLAWSRGDLDEARIRWTQALERQQQDDPRAALRLRLNLALVEDGLGNTSAAERHYLEGWKLARGVGDATAEATILNNLAVQLTDDARYDEAEVLLRRALAQARTARERVLEGYVLDSTARAALGRAKGTGGKGTPARARPGRNGDARSLSATASAVAFTIGTETGDVRLQIEALLTLARARLQAGSAAEAARCARGALERATGAGWQPLVETAEQLLDRATSSSSA